MRSDGVLRCLRLLRLLVQTRPGLTVPQLCHRLEIGRRTLYRDFDVLEALGVTILRETTIEAAPHGCFTQVRCRADAPDAQAALGLRLVA